MFHRRYILASSLVAAAIAGISFIGLFRGDAPTAILEAPDEVLNLSPERCDAIGGKIIQVCRTRVERCVIDYPDAGKPCNDFSQCKGGCYMDFEKMCANGGDKCLGANGPPNIGEKSSGYCRKNNDPCGNFWKIDGGKVVDTNNVD
jgi:hypothetical protein